MNVNFSLLPSQLAFILINLTISAPKSQAVGFTLGIRDHHPSVSRASIYELQ